MIIVSIGCASPVAELSEALSSADPSISVGAEPTASVPAPTSEASSAPAVKELEVGRVGEVIVPDLRLRSAPGLTSEVFGTASRGWYGWIYEGPVESDGFTWYRVVLAPTAQATFGCLAPPAPCTAPPGAGWLASGPSGDSGWFAPVACPPLPSDLAELAEVHHLLNAPCFGGDSISVTGRLDDRCAGQRPEPFLEPGWLGDYCWRLTTGSSSGAGIWVAFASGAPANGGAVSLTGHFDDPAAEACAPASPETVEVEVAVQICRNSFVVDEWRFTE